MVMEGEAGGGWLVHGSGFLDFFDLCTELLFGNYLGDLIGPIIELRSI